MAHGGIGGEFGRRGEGAPGPVGAPRFETPFASCTSSARPPRAFPATRIPPFGP